MPVKAGIVEGWRGPPPSRAAANVGRAAPHGTCYYSKNSNYGQPIGEGSDVVSRVTLGILAAGYGLGATGWLLDWRSHLTIVADPGAARTMSLAHSFMYAAAAVVVLMLAIAAGRRLSQATEAGLWGAGAVATLVLVGPPVLMMAAGVRAGWLMGYMSGTGMVPSVLPLLAWTFWVGWLLVRQVGLRRAATAGLGIAVVLLGLGVDLAWHRANPAANDMAMNMLLLPGHQIQLVGFLVGLLGSLSAIVIGNRRSGGTTATGSV